ncbi:MAG: N-acetyltransferase family protein [Gammaproteobacteria bacterium]
MSRPAVFAAPQPAAVRVRPASIDDLPAINAIVERAVMTWQLAERVKRLSLPSYRYHAHDFVHMQLVVAEDAHGTLLGVAAWDAADARDTPGGQRGLLLHGLYVDPAHQRAGVGTRLLDAAADAARDGGYDGLLVKAQADANGFFAARSLARLDVVDPLRDYPHRFWLACTAAAVVNAEAGHG